MRNVSKLATTVPMRANIVVHYVYGKTTLRCSSNVLNFVFILQMYVDSRQGTCLGTANLQQRSVSIVQMFVMTAPKSARDMKWITVSVVQRSVMNARRSARKR